MFLNTLAISEKTTRTALDKEQATGVLIQDQRGGRTENQAELDAIKREAILNHIKRFPAVESHYCRANSTRIYLCEDLSFRKMHTMFCKEWTHTPKPPGYDLYKSICDEQNISIHHPKKDQCSLSGTYLKGHENTKKHLQERFDNHISEKTKVRQLKRDCKKDARISILCANFDLQQVIYLPRSQDSNVFYKRRLSNFNLTFYNIANTDCQCYLWHEGQSKRGSSEIATAVHKALKFYDEAGVKKAYLFSDGCSGQNKNSVLPAMMLNFVLNSTNMHEISLRYFVTSHGQCEGDSAHSAINHALTRAGDVFQPIQLEPIVHGARKKPYTVNMLQYDSFLDFKSMAKDLRILESRDEKVDWNDIMEVQVLAKHPNTVFYKTSHNDVAFSEINLKRLSKPAGQFQAKQLNQQPPKIPKAKWIDLVKLCTGDTPVVKLPEHKAFYMNLASTDDDNTDKL